MILHYNFAGYGSIECNDDMTEDELTKLVNNEIKKIKAASTAIEQVDWNEFEISKK